MNPTVSVIVPIYNVGAYVGECIDSLKAQTHGDFEVVCVDDGSTDDSLARAREAAGDDGRFTFVQRANGGLSAARNTGIGHARGRYLLFLDSDDCYKPETIEHLCARAEADDLDLVDFTAWTFYDNEQAEAAHREDFYETRAPIEGVMSGPDLFVAHMRQRSYASSACMHLVKRSVLDRAELRFCEGIIHEDELFSPLLYAAAGSSAFLCETLYCRRMREGSIMTAERGLSNVRSIFIIAQLLHAWLCKHAEECSPAFVDAYTLNLSYLCFNGYLDMQGVDGEALERYLGSLGAAGRVAFDQMIRFASVPADNRFNELLESKTYRLGDALACAPRTLRGLLRRPKK